VDRRSGADHAGRELSRAHAGQAQPRAWTSARTSRAMITRPTCPTSASTPHAGEHETLVAHAAHLIAELEPALPVYAGEHEPGSGRRRARSRAGPGPLDTS
jgi:hypothetical protein